MVISLTNTIRSISSTYLNVFMETSPFKLRQIYVLSQTDFNLRAIVADNHTTNVNAFMQLRHLHGMGDNTNVIRNPYCSGKGYRQFETRQFDTDNSRCRHFDTRQFDTKQFDVRISKI